MKAIISSMLLNIYPYLFFSQRSMHKFVYLSSVRVNIYEYKKYNEDARNQNFEMD